MAAAHRGFAGVSKPTDNEIEGPEHYAAKIAAIEAADVSIIWPVVMVVSNNLFLFPQSCILQLCSGLLATNKC